MHDTGMSWVSCCGGTLVTATLALSQRAVAHFHFMPFWTSEVLLTLHCAPKLIRLMRLHGGLPLRPVTALYPVCWPCHVATGFYMCSTNLMSFGAPGLIVVLVEASASNPRHCYSTFGFVAAQLADHVIAPSGVHFWQQGG